ncbi:MAG: tetratricopeptide repeat protein [Spirulina sp. SIO3F2]|nr:tetratricopeptide repeat protein [Spirulina sp. SIO3F2]
MTERSHLSSEPDNSLTQAIADYQTTLTVLTAPQPPTPDEILHILTVRDTVQAQLTLATAVPASQLAQLTLQDQHLRAHPELLASQGLFDQWQQTVSPPAEHWWWFPQVPEVVDPWDQFDWLWNLLTATFLTGFAANMVAVIPIVFSAGLGFLESLGLVGPGGLLALIASQANKGDESVSSMKRLLQFLGIPSRFQSEFTAALALFLFIGAYVAQTRLPDYYFQKFVHQAQQSYVQGDLKQAQYYYEKALELSQTNNIKGAGEVYRSLGIIRESLGDDTSAIPYYVKAFEERQFNVLNNLGRVHLNQDNLLQAEVMLNVGLVRTESDATKFQAHYRRNLGWVYLKQERYDAALAMLDEAIAHEQELEQEHPGQGLAHCLKAVVYESLPSPDSKQAEMQWQQCQEHARPETFSEYKAIINYNPELAGHINLSAFQATKTLSSPAP